jgi:sigma-54 dependent transcriptional regulator, acetoin dehydrogenase operon transcriptional activator AcoR
VAAVGLCGTTAVTERLLDFDEILGESAVMQEIRALARKMSMAGATILIEGETGVGKELFARAIHSAGPTAHAPLCRSTAAACREIWWKANCSVTLRAPSPGRGNRAIPAKSRQPTAVSCVWMRLPRCRLICNLFYCEFWTTAWFIASGSDEGRPVQVRLVSMTNRDLLAEVEGGRLRRDLYYRIAVMRLPIPPLRSRGDNVALLAHHFARLAAVRLDRPLPPFDDEVLDLFRRYAWPGNVRELRNVVENMILLGSSERLRIHEVPMEVRRQVSPPVNASSFEQSLSIHPNLKRSERAANRGSAGGDWP